MTHTVTEGIEKAKVGDGATGGVIDVTEALTKRQKEVLKLIASETTIIYTELADALGINESLYK